MTIDHILQEICEQVEQDYQMSGLSQGLYSDYAKEVTKRYIIRNAVSPMNPYSYDCVTCH